MLASKGIPAKVEPKLEPIWPFSALVPLFGRNDEASHRSGPEDLSALAAE